METIVAKRGEDMIQAPVADVVRFENTEQVVIADNVTISYAGGEKKNQNSPKRHHGRSRKTIAIRMLLGIRHEEVFLVRVSESVAMRIQFKDRPSQYATAADEEMSVNSSKR